MNIVKMSKLVPQKQFQAKPEEVGTLDALALQGSLIQPPPPVSIDDAIARRADFIEFNDNVKRLAPIGKSIVEAIQRVQKGKVEQDKKEEKQHELIKKALLTIAPEIGIALGSIFTALAGMVVSVVTFVSTTIFSIVGSIVGFLLANPVALAAIAVAGIAFGAYLYLKEPEAEPKKVSPHRAPKAVELVPAKEEVVAEKPPVAVTAEPPGPASNALYQLRQDKIKSDVADALTTASRVVDVPIHLLSSMAGIESGLGRNTKASTSSATGMFQFIDSTWKKVLKAYGPRYGVPLDASRNDNKASAIMAAAMMKHEGYPAVAKLVPNPSVTDIYLTHFLGSAGGARFLKGYLTNPDSPGTEHVGSGVASSNAAIFYANGRPRTIKEIYGLFASKVGAWVEKTATIEAQPAVVAVPPVRLAAAGSAPTPPNPGKNKEFVRRGNKIIEVA